MPTLERTTLRALLRVKTTYIGAIELGIDGRDIYYRLDLNEADLTAISGERCSELSYVDRTLLAEAAFPCSGVGSLFCDRVTVLPFPDQEDRFVGIVHVRRDC